MTNLKRTVAVRPINTTKIGGANGKYFDEKFQKYAREALQKAGYFPPVKGKSLYAINGHVQAFSHKDHVVIVSLWCNAEEHGQMKHEWGTTKSESPVRDVKSAKDMLWASTAWPRVMHP